MKKNLNSLFFLFTFLNIVFSINSSVSVFYKIDPTKNTAQALFQHLLFVSSKSCYWEGNLYSQHASQAYSHILISQAADYSSGSLIAAQYNEPLFGVLNPKKKSSKANLTAEQSFFLINGKGIIVSAVKKQTTLIFLS